MANEEWQQGDKRIPMIPYSAEPSLPKRTSLRIYYRQSTHSTIVETDGEVVGELVDGLPQSVQDEFWAAMRTPRWIVKEKPDAVP